MNRAHVIAGLLSLAFPAITLAQPADTTPAAPAEPPPAPSADDIAKAADATADAAAVGAVAPTKAQSVAVAPEIDLASLGLDPGGSALDDKLNIYGFADLSAMSLHFADSHGGLLPDSRSFASGGLDLYVAKNLSEGWRALSEVRFLYLPNGGQNADGTVTTTAINDPTNFSRPITWGGVSIERAYVEYDVNKHLTIRAGRFLTPYGIWNTDHGAPAIIATYRPYVIGEQYFPEHQTGLELYGNTIVGEYRIGYHATATNGRSPTESVSDPDMKLGYGGRLEFEAPWAGTLKLGASAYGGRFTDAIRTLGTTPVSYDERSYGVDASWDHGGLHAQSEVIGNDQHYLVNARARTTSGFAADGRQWGGYAIVGYRTSRWWNVMPYALVEFIDPIDKTYYDTITAETVGLNFRPTANIVLKLQYGAAHPRGNGLLGNGAIDIATSQVAWVF